MQEKEDMPVEKHANTVNQRTNATVLRQLVFACAWLHLIKIRETKEEKEGKK